MRARLRLFPTSRTSSRTLKRGEPHFRELEPVGRLPASDRRVAPSGVESQADLASPLRSFRRYRLLPPRGMNQEPADLPISVGLKRDSKRELRGKKVPEALGPEA